MEIQLALDRLTKEQCIHIIDETIESIDCIEIGTGVIKEYGITILKEIKAEYPDSLLLADMKTCDAGKHEAVQAFRAGADITTVMAFAANQTIIDALTEAEKYGKRIMIDLLGIQTRDRVEELVGLGVDLFCLHKGKDMQIDNQVLLKDLFQLTEGIDGIDVAIAGGINVDNIEILKNYKVDICIVGSAITASKKPGEISRKIADIIVEDRN